MHFARALVYVGLSRCTKLEGLHIVKARVSHKNFDAHGADRKHNLMYKEIERLRDLQNSTIAEGFCMHTTNTIEIKSKLK
jgi:ATP-dependent exoDNAse (exonuclease V) alpha subunit